ncbi:MAG TPA: 2-phospho-L-lactate guanylyltransferase [Candidatus Dormibacteraeota bacterium]|nr:2-phospho-L-lactate guanylyltransferase [Candidatus Dormibacteraeota bacterium]
MTSAALRPLVAIVPVRALEGAKSRLGEVLDAEERRDLVIELLERTIRAALEASIVDRVIVVSEDPDALAIAARAGARTLRDDGGGLNGSLALARAAARSDGAGSVLVLPGDLPSIAPGAIAAIASAAAQPPVVVLVTDRHHRGTNALLLSPPDVIPFAFGGDSRAAHAALAAGAGATYVELEGPLSLDLDTPDDLLLFDELGWPADRIRSGHRG